MQFAYQPKKCVNDAILTLIHMVLQHVDKVGRYVRITFVDFSSAFNTIQNHVLVDKLDRWMQKFRWFYGFRIFCQTEHKG